MPRGARDSLAFFRATAVGKRDVDIAPRWAIGGRLLADKSDDADLLQTKRRNVWEPPRVKLTPEFPHTR